MHRRFILVVLGLLIFCWTGCQLDDTSAPEETYARALGFDEIGYPKEAGHWYRKAAYQGHPIAQVEVGFMYRFGKAGLLRDPYEAERWFGSVVREASYVALADFGYPSEYGINGVLRDDAEAAYWFRTAVRSCWEAVRKGDLEEQMLLGGLYGTGMGVEKDRTMALWLWRDAAEKGHAPAQYWLARAYEHANQYRPAFSWMARAAEQGWPAAQYHLAFMYQSGYGVQPDYEEAVTWLRQSAAHGYLFAERQLRGMQEGGVFEGMGWVGAL